MKKLILLAAITACGGGDVYGEWSLSIEDHDLDADICNLTEPIVVTFIVHPETDGAPATVEVEDGGGVGNVGCFGRYERIGDGIEAECRDLENTDERATITIGSEVMTPRLELALADDSADYVFYTTTLNGPCIIEGAAAVLERVRE